MRARYSTRVSLWRRLWPPRPLRLCDLPEILAAERDALVQLTGRVEALEPIFDPVSGEVAVAIEYRAVPQSNVVGVAGALSVLSRAFVFTCQQATDFIVREGGHRVLVRVEPGSDLGEVHREMLSRHGVGLHTERALVRPDARVCVVGRRVGAVAASPLREEPYLAVVQAQRFWVSS